MTRSFLDGIGFWKTSFFFVKLDGPFSAALQMIFPLANSITMALILMSPNFQFSSKFKHLLSSATITIILLTITNFDFYIFSSIHYFCHQTSPILVVARRPIMAFPSALPSPFIASSYLPRGPTGNERRKFQEQTFITTVVTDKTTRNRFRSSSQSSLSG